MNDRLRRTVFADGGSNLDTAKMRVDCVKLSFSLVAAHQA